MNFTGHSSRMGWAWVIIPVMAVGFFMPSPSNPWLGLLIKGTLFLLATVGFLFSVTTVKKGGEGEPFRAKQAVEKGNDPIAEMKQGDLGWEGFGAAFDRFCAHYVEIVGGAMVATCGGVYLKTTQGLLMTSGFLRGKMVPVRVKIREDGLVGRVITEGQPILRDDLPRGYRMEGIEEAITSSFLGVPLFRDDAVIGVLAMGSEVGGTFGQDDLDFLSHAGGLLADVMSAYHRGLRGEAEQHIARIHREMEKALQEATDEKRMFMLFVMWIQKIFPFERATLCVRQGDEGMIRHVFGEIGNAEPGMRFPLDEGLNGWVLKRNASLLISDMAEGNYPRPRYRQGEDTRHGFRSFLAIPLGRDEKAWGSFSLESKKEDQYGERGKELLIQLVRYFEAIMAPLVQR